MIDSDQEFHIKILAMRVVESHAFDSWVALFELLEELGEFTSTPEYKRRLRKKLREEGRYDDF